MSDLADRAAPTDPDAHRRRFLGVQRSRNEETRGLWEPMGAHRRRLTREILRLAGGRVAVLGAGNVNDLELEHLLPAFDEVHLVDLDLESMERGVRRQSPSADGKVRLHGGVDFSGLSYALGRGAADAGAFAADLREGIARSFEDPKACEVVVSTCVLTQLIDGLLGSGSSDAVVKERAVAVREQHVDLLVERTVPGGSALLVTDMVSSDTAPELRTCPDLALARLRDDLVARRNYFHGTNPYAVEQYVLRRHRRAVARVERRSPWRWTLGERAFLVTALRMQRAPE